MEPACEINPNQIKTVIDVFLTDLLKDPGNYQKIKPKILGIENNSSE